MKVVTRLLKWYRKEGRDLPWRKTTDPYRILVSEIMLQQTQVSRGLLFFEKWLEQFPNWQTLASASNADVIHAWAGLGYNRRALMLRDIAVQIVENGVPKSEDEWLKLKGVGPYTAAALTVFSLQKRAFPIDTNIRRVIGRLFLGKSYAQPSDDAEIMEAFRAELADTAEFHDVPQALFDLATMHCTKVPDCAACPLKDQCVTSSAFLAGEVEPPKRMIKKAKEKIHRNKKYPDRIFRGRILKLVREQGSVKIDAIGHEIDPTFDKEHDHKWLEAMVERLKKDKMIEQNGGRIRIFGAS